MRGRRHRGGSFPLYNAIDLYKGDFLSEELYTSWIDTKREELRKLYIYLLYKIADIQESEARQRLPSTATRRLFKSTPFRAGVPEADDDLLKQAYATEAIKVYKDCCKALQEGLDTEPEALTTSIYRKIMETSNSYTHL